MNATSMTFCESPAACTPFLTPCVLIFFFKIFASFKNKAYLCSDKYVKPFNSKYYAEQREKKEK